MFRCFWNWMTSPIGMSFGKESKISVSVGGRAEERRRKKQRRRIVKAEEKRKERERQMSQEDIERNKELLKETFKKLNGFYKSKKEK